MSSDNPFSSEQIAASEAGAAGSALVFDPKSVEGNQMGASENCMNDNVIVESQNLSSKPTLTSSGSPNQQQQQQLPGVAVPKSIPASPPTKSLDQSEPFTQNNIARPAPSGSVCYKVFVGGLGGQTNSESLRAFFVHQYGEENVESAIVMEILDRRTGITRSRGFGFVVFRNPETMDGCLKGIRTFEIDGKECEVKSIEDQKTQPGQQMNGAGGGEMDTMRSEIEIRKVFCGGLAPQVTEQILQEWFVDFFRKSGIAEPETAVTESKVMVDRLSGRSRCFGYVTFRDRELHDKVVANRDQNVIEGKWCDVKPASQQRKGKGKGAVAGYPNQWGGHDQFAAAAQFGGQQQFAVPYGQMPGVFPVYDPYMAAYMGAAPGYQAVQGAQGQVVQYPVQAQYAAAGSPYTDAAYVAAAATYHRASPY